MMRASLKELPIAAVRTQLKSALQIQNRVVVQAPTGSGKSTRIPGYLLDDLQPAGQVVVLQPRRMAARMLARRVAWERGGVPGDEVGFQVRFEACCGKETRIRYVTEGVLFRELLMDPDLSAVSVVVFDEFHERHLFGDTTLAAVRALQERRTDLRLVVMSATLDSQPVQDYLQPCSLLTAEGRSWPVDIQYVPRRIDFREKAVWEVAAEGVRTVLKATTGHVLVFMPGAYEIRKTVEALRHGAGLGVEVLPLYGELSQDEQEHAVACSERRKVIVATNVAETSLTIDGVTAVVDSGLVRTARYDPGRGIDMLLVEHISRASADQRAGRAGRQSPGVALRLWTQNEQEGRMLHTQPEIMRCDLTETVLMIHMLGFADVDEFPWFERPDARLLDAARQYLQDIAALDEGGKLTERGRLLPAFPLHPRYALMLLLAEPYQCVRDVALIAALMQGRSILVKRMDEATEERLNARCGSGGTSDLIQQMRAFQYAADNRFSLQACRELGIHAGAARTADALYRQFLRIAKRQRLTVNDELLQHEAGLRKCLLSGLVDRLALRMDQGTLRCRLIHGRAADLSRKSSVRKAPLLVAAEIAEIEGGRRSVNVLLNGVTAVEEDWLEELFPGSIQEQEETFWDARMKRVRRRLVRVFHDLVLTEKCDDTVDPEESGRLLAARILDGSIRLNSWDDAVNQWVERVNVLAAVCPEWDIPPIDTAALETILQDMCYGHATVREMKKVSMLQAVKNWLNPMQRQLVEQQVPDRYRLPGGRRARIHYKAGSAPVMRAVIQDLFEVTQSPLIANGRLRLCIEILAPNQRPVQVTKDLASFWANSYPSIRQELQRKYYKHEWR